MHNYARAAMVLGVALLVGAAARPNATSGGGDAVKGRHDFVEFGCSSCHGTTGAGGGWQGPKLAPEPVPFEAFLAQLREPAAKMPRYSPAVLSDREAIDLYAYLRSVPKGRTADKIEMLKR